MTAPPTRLRAAARTIILSSALVGALSSFAMNAVLPSLPEIQAHFAARLTTTQLIISAGFLALALGNLLVAPLSDRIGRKPVILGGVAVFAGASLLAALAPHIAVVIAARIAQAFGIGAATAVARAALNDHFGPEGAATGIAYTAMAILFVPLVASSIGGYAAEWFGWRMPFLLSALAGMAAALYIALRTPPAPVRRDSPATPRSGLLHSYATLLAEPRYRAYALFGSLLLCGVYAFIAGAPYVARTRLGLSAADYGLWAGLPALASLVAFGLAARVARQAGAATMLAAGTAIAVAGGAVLLLGVALGQAHPLALFGPAAAVSFGQSIALPNALAGALGIRPGAAGAAAGLMGFLQLALSALVAQGVALFANGTAWPLAVGVFASTLGAAAAWWRLRALGALR